MVAPDHESQDMGGQYLCPGSIQQDLLGVGTQEERVLALGQVVNQLVALKWALQVLEDMADDLVVHEGGGDRV